MEGNEVVKAGLQEAINLEASLAVFYAVNAADLDRLGLSTADGFEKLGGQAADYQGDLTDLLLFLEGDPEVEPAPARTYDTIGEILAAAVELEIALVAKYTELCRSAWEAGDLEVFHLYQHLAKWHRRGGNGNKGHLKWLQKQTEQYKRAGGEAAYIQMKA